MELDYQRILNEIHNEIAYLKGQGDIANYIPELANVTPDKFAMALQCTDGSLYTVGSAQDHFSIQSISKVLALTLAMSQSVDTLWKRVDVEPSGDPFNSLAQLELEFGIPRNPLINSGALVISDILSSIFESPKEAFLEFVSHLTGQPVTYDLKVASSEKSTGYRNAAMANLLKSFGNIHNDVDRVLDFYFHQCSLSMSCVQLTSAFMFLANEGRTFEGEQIVTKSQSKRANAIMQTCGFYDEAGEFSFRVGLPGKSGVGGGIVAIHPGVYAVTVWSPRLNPKGNSVIGMKALELLTTKTGYSIF